MQFLIDKHNNKGYYIAHIIILDFVVSIYTVILCRLHRIFCGL